jgi:methylated-DNA-[protein]-cysteine S-methyltransferase
VFAYTIFPTAIGPCALAWRGETITGAALAGADEDATIRAVASTLPDAVRADPPAWMQSVVSRVQRLFEGVPVSFHDVPLALDGAAPFERLVYRETLAIAHGETRTYGEVARALGQPGAARAVGRALGRNPIPIIIPCHRVLAADGRSGGFSAPGGVSTKMKLLDIERARRGVQPGLFDDLGWAARP